MASSFNKTTFESPKITFGKYKGHTIEDLTKRDPSYLLWAHSNVSFFTLSEEQIKACRQHVSIGEEEEESPYYVQHALYDDYYSESLHEGAFGFCD